MPDVIISPGKTGQKVMRALQCARPIIGPAFFFGQGAFERDAGTAQTFVFCTAEIEEISSDSPLLVLCEERPRIPKVSGKPAIAITCSQVESLPECCEIISCGLGAKDTISISSVMDDSAVISVQRSLRTLSGGLVGPCDLPIKTSGRAEIGPVLAACAVLILLDRSERLSEIIFKPN